MLQEQILEEKFWCQVLPLLINKSVFIWACPSLRLYTRDSKKSKMGMNQGKENITSGIRNKIQK